MCGPIGGHIRTHKTPLGSGNMRFCRLLQCVRYCNPAAISCRQRLRALSSPILQSSAIFSGSEQFGDGSRNTCSCSHIGCEYGFADGILDMQSARPLTASSESRLQVPAHSVWYLLLTPFRHF